MANGPCIGASAAAVVLGLAFLGSLIALVVLATSKPGNELISSSAASSLPPPPPMVFKEYTANVFSANCDRYGRHCVMGDKVVYNSFSDGRYCATMLGSDGNVSVRQIAPEVNKSAIFCQNIINHTNCFRRTMDDGLFFSLEGYTLVSKELSCYYFAPDLQTLLPNRKLDKCDYYASAHIVDPENTGESTEQVLVESGTNYPVLVSVKDFLNAHSNTVLYESFIPEKPSDESCLIPPNVTIYDLRNGEGDCSEKPEFTSKPSEASDKLLKNMRRASLVSQALHLPSVFFSGLSSSFVHSATSNRARTDIPENFSALENWPDCTDVISAITNQNPCGSCWAMSSSAVLSDRMCIAKNVSKRMSPQYMIYCGSKSMGCVGTSAVVPWEQLFKEGTVPDECVPYTARDGSCPKVCRDGSNITDDMKVYVKSIVVPWGDTDEKRVQAIQSEILNNGPVQANFQVFSDFYAYAGGIYHRTKDSTITSGHAVRVVGWGSENGVDYWLVANSWGPDWGENGFFRIRRGNNECNFEEIVLAGLVN